MNLPVKTFPAVTRLPDKPRTDKPALKHQLRQLGLSLYARVSPAGAARLVNRQFFRPSRLPMPSRYEYLLDEADSHTQLHHVSNTIPVYSWGEGPTVLGVHGWSGAGIQFGAYVKPLVAAGYRVVLFDAPGHGRAQGSQTDLFEMAEVVRRVGLGSGPVQAILAHSLGAVAAARALTRGLGAEYLVLLAPPSDLSSVVNGLGARLGIPAGVLRDHRQLMEARFGEDLWNQLSLPQLAPGLPGNGLVVYDSDDQHVPPAQSERVRTAWSGAAVFQTRGLGHHRLLWHPDVVDAVTTHIKASS
ncbi:alpha/beta hydrolase [Marinobacter halodurans]|uniref:Alpha/beta hydrolase n=1 Tax=Marinobacter halodurans TaxID=2528979 RepID=A0ABY1ZGT4_9GAMM|nr:alpha/beta hydrolase [Marinobacter halodurans]TBW48854.1 alpha/beta hydrolase [Marinobacter halodurans]